MTSLAACELQASELHFASGLPGFPGTRVFGWVRWGPEGSPVRVLNAVEPPGLQFVVVAPEPFFPDYEPAFSSEHLAAVGLSAGAPATILVILTLGVTPADTTANLLGPLLVNPVSGQAIQAVQPLQSWSTRTPVPFLAEAVRAAQPAATPAG